MSEAARLAGVDRKLVRRLAAEGRLRRRADDRFDPVEFAADWSVYEATKRPKVDGSGTHGTVPGAGELEDGDALPEDVRRMTYQQARAHRERFTALQAELEYDQAAGRLVDRETVRRQFFSVARRARDYAMSVPDRLAPQLLGVTDLEGLRRAIEAEMRRLCETMAALPPE